MAEVRMPQLGETVTEGTITRWFKAVGDAVAVDEVLFEITTDKVDSEVPSPVAGVLAEIVVAEGETAPVGALLAVVTDSAAGGAPAPVPAPSQTSTAPPPPPPPPATGPQVDPTLPPPPPPPSAPSAAPGPAPETSAPTPSDAATSGDGLLISPVVRRLLSEHGIDPATVSGTGIGGRITRSDVERVIGARGAMAPSGPPATAAPSRGVAETAAPASPATARSTRGDTVVPLNNIRRRTGEHMVQSKSVAPHAMTAVEVDYEAVERVRRAHRDQWAEEEGFSLTYLPFIARAVIDALADFPHLNATVGDGDLVVHHFVNLSVAVDLDFEGLLAPVVHDADGMRLRGIARDIHDLATRARSKRLSADEILGGTFTLSNSGSFGTHMVIPIINQPQVAIMSTDGVARKPVVVAGPDGSEAIAIHSVGILALAWDHRAFDGAYAAAFMRRVKEILETRDWSFEI